MYDNVSALDRFSGISYWLDFSIYSFMNKYIQKIIFDERQLTFLIDQETICLNFTTRKENSDTRLSALSQSPPFKFYKYKIIAGMSESNLASKSERYNLDNDDLKRKRRTRNDEDGRNFSCNCGKSYLSYPALYTHVKTKHNGKPEFTKLAQYSKDQNQSMDIKDDDDIESMEKIEDSNNVEQLKRYLNKFFPLAQKQKDSDKKSRDLTKDDLTFLKGIKDYWEKRKKEDQPHQNEAYATSIDNVFGKFLIEMDSDISKNCQKFISEFILNVRSGLNELKGNQDYCKITNAFQLPALMNDIFTDKFQKMQEGHLYLRHPTIICKTIYHFSRWLFQERFTNLSLKFNTV